MAVLPTGIGAAAGGGGYNIERSLRFNSADSAYLNRTPASASNRKTWTWSGWIKRSGISSGGILFAARTGAGGTYLTMVLSSVDDFRMESNSETAYPLYKTNALFRDPSAWYHFVVALDMTQATSTNRIKVWVNNVLQTTASYNVPAQNTDLAVNSTETHLIGQQASGTYFNGYLTEINFIDGQALTPSSFGETDSATGVWKPKAYSGTYGTNGFYLKFADNSGTTSTTLGKDSSGNGNNWTPNNFSVTAGAGNDSLVDSPTPYGTDTGVGGEVRGNYATWNPLDKNSNGSLLNGNLDNSNSSANNAGVRSTFALPSSEKWYAELRVNTSTSGSVALGFGFATASADLAGSVDGANKYDIYGSSSGSIFSNTSTVTSSLGAFTAGDILQIAYDGATGKAWLGKNNTWYNSTGGTTGNPAAGTNQTFTFTTQMFLYSYYYNVSGSLNCGQRAFAYTAPSGFKALCTQNLPTPTIGATSTTQANDYFNTILYNGNGNTGQTVTGVGFQPDFLWLKNRNQAGGYYHCLFDSVRGAGYRLKSNATDAEANATAIMSAFTSDGFTFPAGQGNTIENDSAGTYVAWNWKANGAGSSNTAGTITSTVSANTTSGFSIVTYTGTNASGATVGHGLGAVPAMIIIKNRSSAEAWPVYHAYNTSAPETDYLVLNTTAATADATTPWNDTLPTSTVFTLGNWNALNENGSNHVAYCFAPVAGYSAAFSYTGNASSDGPYIHLGFTPKFILIKSSSATGDWVLEDRSRSPYNVSTNYLLANSSAAETTGQLIDFLSNGFKIRVAVSSAINGSGTSYIGFAWAENPFKYSIAR